MTPFTYLGSWMAADGVLDVEIIQRVQSGKTTSDGFCVTEESS